MADQKEAQLNGPSGESGKYIDSIDPEDPEYIRQMRRPAEVKEDVNQMQHRKRVSQIMQSKAFRDELEQIVNDQIMSGPHPASLIALQQISELMLPHSRFGHSSITSGTIIPIADIRGVDSLNYTKGEKFLRCKVAAAYRLVDLFGWSQGIYSHITSRINQDYEHFLIQPHGLMYHEVTASSLMKCDMQGEVIDPGTTNLSLNKNGYLLHAAIHASRPDIKAIIHIQNPAVVSVSAMKCGFLPISQEAMMCGDISYFDYTGSMSDQEDRDKITRALGPLNKVLFLRNYGVMACGESIEEAFLYAKNVTSGCDTQLSTLPIGLDNIILPSEEIQKKTFEMGQERSQQPVAEGRRKWRRGEMEFEALMRHLDNAGYRTGYIYHEPLIRQGGKKDRANSDVELPPTSSSFAYYWDDDKMASPMKQHMDLQKKHFKSEWLATPNAYKREEIEETGTPNPKKITKWVPESGDDKRTTPIKLENPNQFAPIGADPKELKLKHKEIRKDYYEEKIHAGPQSRILEGMTWDEAQKIKDGHVSGTSDSIIVVGAASKGIIQRDHQHNAVVYKTYYQPNPFDNMTEDEVEKYKTDIAKKGQDSGDAGEELEPGPDGKLISTEERMQHVRAEVSQQGAVNGEEPTSPAKSTASSEGEGSPTKGVSSEVHESPSKGEKKKKKFRMPSFSKKKDKK